MKLELADRKKYPKLAAYIQKRLPTVGNHVAIRAALKKYGHFTDGQVDTALSWGNDPRVVIVDFAVNACGAGGTQAYGCTRKANAKQIEVSKKYVEQFEKDPALGVDNKNAKGSVVYIIGATILHELCHWGNYKNNVPEKKEMGEAFEKAVYGKTVW